MSALRKKKETITDAYRETPRMADVERSARIRIEEKMRPVGFIPRRLFFI